MTVCLCGSGADLDKVNKYLSFSPFDIILISEYVDDMKLPDCECYYIAKSEIKNTKSIILQISRKRHLQYTSVVLCKDILLDSKLSKIIFECSVKNITFVLNINRMFDLHYLDDCRKNISTETHQIIEVFSGRKLPQYHWLFAVLPSVLYLDDDVLSAQLSCDKSCAKIKTPNYEFEIHICDDSSLADTIVQINGTKICEINYYSAIINTFDKNDLRKTHYLIWEEIDYNGTPVYRQPTSKYDVQRRYKIEYRYERGVWGTAFKVTEAYMNAAEAAAMLYKENNQSEYRTKAQTLIDALRIKRFSQTTYKPTTISEGEQLVSFIRDERRRELCFENHRWFDLRRYGMEEIKHTWYDTSGEPIEYILEKNDPGFTLQLPNEAFEHNSSLVQNEPRK